MLSFLVLYVFDSLGVCCVCLFLHVQGHMCAQIKPCLELPCSAWAGETQITKIFQHCFLSVQLGCSYTRGNNTYLLCLTVLMETHQRSWKTDRSRERGGKQAWDTLLLYCCTLYCPRCFSRRWQWALSHISSPFCWRWRPKWNTLCRCCFAALKFKAPESPTQPAQTAHFSRFQGTPIHISVVWRYSSMLSFPHVM